MNSPTTSSQHSASAISPVVIKLPNELGPRECFERLVHLPFCLALESGMRHEVLGRYSYICADPIQVLKPQRLTELKAIYQQAPNFLRIPELPPFQGGFAGLIGYEYCRSIEKIPKTTYNEFPIDALTFGLYDCVFVFDHARGSAWLISQGINENLIPCAKRARKRADEFLTIVQSESPKPKRFECSPGEIQSPQFETHWKSPRITSDFSRTDYLQAVQQCIDYIHAGDIFQVNLSQRLLTPANCLASELYSRLKTRNASTFSSYFDLGLTQIISASPERLVSVFDRVVETRPIKGTRPRTHKPQIDISVSQQLLSSEKDRAENIMIVDLMRNDLSQFCRDESIEVTQLCGLEKYRSVFHLVSAVKGVLLDSLDAFDAVEKVFPGGSITGAPKVRAMEIISELEPTSRGAYCGSLGYFSLTGDADFNILIRTITQQAGWLQIPVGGGLVAQSDPKREYDETWTKATGMLAALSREPQA